VPAPLRMASDVREDGSPGATRVPRYGGRGARDKRKAASQASLAVNANMVLLVAFIAQ